MPFTFEPLSPEEQERFDYYINLLNNPDNLKEGSEEPSDSILDIQIDSIDLEQELDTLAPAKSNDKKLSKLSSIITESLGKEKRLLLRGLYFLVHDAPDKKIKENKKLLEGYLSDLIEYYRNIPVNLEPLMKCHTALQKGNLKELRKQWGEYLFSLTMSPSLNIKYLTFMAQMTQITVK